MAEEIRREQELRAAAKQLAGVQRQHRPDQTAAARSQAGQKAQPRRAARRARATAQTAAARSQAGQQSTQPQRTNAAGDERRQQILTTVSGKALSRAADTADADDKYTCKRIHVTDKADPTSVGTRSRRYYGCRIPCGSRLYRSGSVAGNVQEGRRSYRFLCKEKQRQRDRCSHKSTDTTGK